MRRAISASLALTAVSLSVGLLASSLPATAGGLWAGDTCPQIQSSISRVILIPAGGCTAETAGVVVEAPGVTVLRGGRTGLVRIAAAEPSPAAIGTQVIAISVNSVAVDGGRGRAHRRGR